MKDKKIALLERQIANLKEEIRLVERRIENERKLTEIAEKRAEVEHTAYERQKDLTDRALRLAEIGKSTSNWQFGGLLGAAAFVLGVLVAK